ncbi:MAG: TRAP transporter small permease [Spirochaetia bacterium]
MEKIVNTTQKCLEIVLGTLVGVLTILCIWQVFARYFFKLPTMAEEELARFGLIWMALLGGTLAFARSEQLAFTLIHEILEKKSPQALFGVKVGINIFVTIVLFAVLVVGGIALVKNNMQQLTPVLQIKKGLIYLIMPISGVLCVFFQANILRKLFKEGI